MDIKLNIAKAGGEDFAVNAQDIITGRTCVIAQSGGGKSYGIAVLCEELCRNNIGFCIVDTEGEYYSLKDKFQLLWVGKNADVDIENINLKELAEKAVQNNIPVILDVSDVVDEKKIVAEFARHLYQAETKLRIPYLLVIEEADKFIPQNISKRAEDEKEVLKQMEEISRRGRKRGLGLLIATQRPASVSKAILSQCGNQLIGKLTTENDLSAVNLFFSSRRELEELPELQPGEFFAMGNISRQKKKIKFNQRETKHEGLTPELLPKSIGKISELKFGIKEKNEEEFVGEPEPEMEESKTSKSVFLVNPIFKKEKINELIDKQRKKQFVLFGEKEKVLNVELVYRPLVFVEIKDFTGFIGKSLKTFSFIIDGIDGRIADLSEGLKYSGGFKGMLGLDESEAEALYFIGNGKTAAEVEMKTNLSDTFVRSVLKKLQKRRLISYKKLKNAKNYFSLIDVKRPNIHTNVKFPAEEGKLRGSMLKIVVKEDDVRNLIKAVSPVAEIIRFASFYYPLYEVHFERRRIEMDGVSGKVIE